MDSFTYHFVSSIVMALFSIAIYKKFLNTKVPFLTAIIPIFTYVIASNFLISILPDPFNTLLALSIVFLTLHLLNISYSFYHAVFVASVVLFVHMTCRMISFHFFYFRDMFAVDLFTVSSLFLEIFFYLVLQYNFDKIPNLFKSKDTESKILLNTIAFILLTLYIATVLVRPYNNNMQPFSLITLQFYLLIILPLLGLVFFLIFYMSKVKDQQQQINENVKQLSTTLNVIIEQHKDSIYLVPNLVATFQGLINEMEHIAGKDESQQIKRIENYLSLIEELDLTETDENIIDFNSEKKEG